MLALISAGTVINYLDRTVLGIAAPQMSSGLHLSPTVMGIVFSAFSWSYAAAQLPGGWLLDRIGTRVAYFLAVTFWSAFTLLQGLARGVVSLVGFRLGLGMSEAPCFPANNRVVGAWFRAHERAKATAVYTVGEYLGLACFGPLLFWISDRYGWRALFLVVGAVGMAFGAAWWLLYRDPPGSRLHGDSRAPVGWNQLRRLLRSRRIWGASLGQFGGNSTLVFFLTWFPSYLAKDRNIDSHRAGWFTALPYLAAAAESSLAAGRLTRYSGEPDRSTSHASSQSYVDCSAHPQLFWPIRCAATWP